MLETLKQQIATMIAQGFEPGAVIMTPPELRNFLVDRGEGPEVYRGGEGSGWEVFGLPIYRSWEISGPAVVSRDVLGALRKMGRPFVGGASMHHAFTGEATTASLDPLLF